MVKNKNYELHKCGAQQSIFQVIAHNVYPPGKATALQLASTKPSYLTEEVKYL
jgi:hypothetical protein